MVRYLTGNGFPHAERRALRGVQDVGDITGCPGLAWEVKAGDAARNASDNQIAAWLRETEVERRNARADLGVLIVARARRNVRDWWAVMTAGSLAALALNPDYVINIDLPVRVTLAQAVVLLRGAGYGIPLVPTEEGSEAS